jgi:hypothetical protein
MRCATEVRVRPFSGRVAGTPDKIRDSSRVAREALTFTTKKTVLLAESISDYAELDQIVII